MNSFQAACCRSHLLLRPGVGKRAGDVFVRVVVGRGTGAKKRAAGTGASEFSQHSGALRRHSFRARWVGSGSPTRLPAEMVVRN